MKAEQQIPLGFEIGTGEPVSVPLGHMAVTGQTQLSGKTTTLEALITRSRTPALAFVTKRGESGFSSARQIAPFFHERADWEFVESILESSMKQKMKFERSWIVRACEGASTLADVRERARDLQSRAKGAFNQDMFMLLGKYLDKVVPLINRLPKSPSMNLRPGLNVMNLLDYPEEMQSLVIASSLRSIHASESGVVTLIPEAWKFVPQGRRTPVRSEAEKLVREGAGLKNYVWIDSQDMAGVEKLILRAASVWIIGVQREMNELKRALGSIPAGIKRPKAEDVAQLGVGEFYACWHSHIHKVYVWPTWLEADQARAIAFGKVSVGDYDYRKPKPKTEPRKAAPPAERKDEVVSVELIQAINNLTAEVRAIREGIEGAARHQELVPDEEPPVNSVGIDEIVEAVMERLPPSIGDPALTQKKIVEQVLARLPRSSNGQAGALSVSAGAPEIEVRRRREIIKVDGATLPGRVAQLVAEHFFDKPKGHRTVWDEVRRRGFSGSNNVQRELEKLAEKGFLTKEPGEGFKTVAGMLVNIVEE